jgi:hypothetical protein
MPDNVQPGHRGLRATVRLALQNIDRDGKARRADTSWVCWRSVVPSRCRGRCLTVAATEKDSSYTGAHMLKFRANRLSSCPLWGSAAASCA